MRRVPDVIFMRDGEVHYPTVERFVRARLGWPQPEEPEPEPGPDLGARREEIVALFRLHAAHPFGGFGAPFGFEVTRLIDEFLALPPAPQKKRYEHWTDDDNVILRTLAKYGADLPLTARALGRGMKIVAHRAVSEGLPSDWAKITGIR